MARLEQAVRTYFAGERIEMIAILIGAAIAVAVAALLWLRLRDGFAVGFAVAVVAAALLLGGTAVSLLVRDGRSASAVATAVSAPATARAAIATEAKRVDAIIRTYPLYRYVAAAILALALAGLLLTTRGWVHGAAAGLLLLVAAQVVIDHYSEARARLYAERLAAG